jgi:hypothetical protein
VPVPQAPQGQPPQGATGPYAPFPPATRPAPPQTPANVPHYNNIPPVAPHYNNIPATGPTAPPRPPRTDLMQNGTVPQTPANGPQTTQYANIPQPTPYANIPRTFATPPSPPQQPAAPGQFPRQKPYIARIPDFSDLPQRADNAPNNAVPGVRPSAPAQQQRPANDQHSAPAQGANPYGKLSAGIMNQAAYNLKHGGPAKDTYGSMHPVEKAAPNAPGSQQQQKRR